MASVPFSMAALAHAQSPAGASNSGKTMPAPADGNGAVPVPAGHEMAAGLTTVKP